MNRRQTLREGACHRCEYRGRAGPEEGAEARASELAWVKKQEVYEKVDESVCWAETGRPPITLKWVDRNKGDDVKENFRSRLVVREVKSQGQAALIPDYALFSSMPPLEGLKILCSLLTSMKAVNVRETIDTKID